MNIPAPWPIETRKEAALAGRSKYYTGKPCKRGHESQRYTTSGLCVACVSMRSRGYKVAIEGARNGLVAVTVQVHPDDKAAIEGTAAALRQGRGL